MKLINIVSELWCRPWAIMPAVHKQLCGIVQAHIDGTAHVAGGIAGAFEKDEDEYGAAVVDGIAVLPVYGVLGQHVGELAKSSGTTDICDISQALAEAVAEPTVKGIFLDVNSPGGTVSGIPELAKEIAQASVKKPVVAFTDSQMASAAYWLASGADAIIASQSAEVGSIGVYMAWLDDSRKLEMEGYKAEIIKRGRFKGMGVSGTSLDADARELLQNQIDEIYNWFTGHVELFREDVSQDAMEGQMFLAGDAKEADLIDLVGTRERAFSEIMEMAKQ